MRFDRAPPQPLLVVSSLAMVASNAWLRPVAAVVISVTGLVSAVYWTGALPKALDVATASAAYLAMICLHYRFRGVAPRVWLATAGMHCAVAGLFALSCMLWSCESDAWLVAHFGMHAACVATAYSAGWLVVRDHSTSSQELEKQDATEG